MESDTIPVAELKSSHRIRQATDRTIFSVSNALVYVGNFTAFTHLSFVLEKAVRKLSQLQFEKQPSIQPSVHRIRKGFRSYLFYTGHKANIAMGDQTEP